MLIWAPPLVRTLMTAIGSQVMTMQQMSKVTSLRDALCLLFVTDMPDEFVDCLDSLLILTYTINSKTNVEANKKKTKRLAILA